MLQETVDCKSGLCYIHELPGPAFVSYIPFFPPPLAPSLSDTGCCGYGTSATARRTLSGRCLR